MKQKFFIFAITLAAICGCIREENAAIDDAPVFQAGFESISTKTYVDDALHLFWTADDRLSIFTNTYNQQYAFDGNTGDNAGSFSKIETGKFVSGSPLDANYAVYPYAVSTSISYGGVISANLPAVQPYAENSFGLGANTMVAVTQNSSDLFLPFQNVCGFLVVRLYGTGTIKSITLTGNSGEKLSGGAEITPTFGEAPSIEMNESATDNIVVDCGGGVTVGATAEEATAFWFCVPPTTFESGFTVTVNDISGATYTKSVSSSRTVTRNVINRMSPFEVDFAPAAPVPEYVDLGLSVKWATFNVGATKPEEFGEYFAWGETEPYYEDGYALEDPQAHWKSGKSGYDWASYGMCNGSGTTMTKYCAQSNYGTVDNRTVLQENDDVAQVMWGDSWRMPTLAEWRELRDMCEWNWTDDYNGTGIAGRIVTGSNGNSIFLPAAGFRLATNLTNAGSYGFYWSSSIYTTRSQNAYFLDFGPEYVYSDPCGRYYGTTVRPVYGEYIKATSISLDKISVNIAQGESSKLMASLEPSNCLEKNVVWTSSNPDIATVDNKGNVTAVNAGSASIVATWAGDSDIYAACTVTVVATAFVDLGLSVKWATFNVGATKPEEFGDYFAWGETEPYYEAGYALEDPLVHWKTGRTGYDWTNYKWCDGSYTTISKYCLYSSFGTVDSRTVLEEEDDVALMKWGGSWRMPTDEEWTELREKCEWNWTDNYNGTGVAGRTVTGSNGNSIFLPAAGSRGDLNLYDAGSKGIYLSSSLSTDDTSSSWSVYFYSSGVSRSFSGRASGHSVRPVSE